MTRKKSLLFMHAHAIPGTHTHPLVPLALRGKRQRVGCNLHSNVPADHGQSRCSSRCIQLGLAQHHHPCIARLWLHPGLHSVDMDDAFALAPSTHGRGHHSRHRSHNSKRCHHAATRTCGSLHTPQQPWRSRRVSQALLSRWTWCVPLRQPQMILQPRALTAAAAYWHCRHAGANARAVRPSGKTTQFQAGGSASLTAAHVRCTDGEGGQSKWYVPDSEVQHWMSSQQDEAKATLLRLQAEGAPGLLSRHAGG